MKGKTRYIFLLLIAVVISFLLIYRFLPNTQNYNGETDLPENFVDSINYDDLNKLKNYRRFIPSKQNACTFAKCFNFDRCQQNHKVYVYPTDPELRTSIVYSNILKAIRESPYYTSKPEEACLFVLSFDTIDRDRTSRNFFPNLQTYLDNLPKDLWNNGENHIIYNLYHGTWPNYSETDIGFNPGKAIMARASASEQNFRHGFDLSFPLFHPEHPFKTPIENQKYSVNAPKEFLVSFKGKRYVYGIGSDTRDSLYHLHDGKRIAMVTTCKHNTDWQNYKDERCEEDNKRYDGWDYQYLLANSTFCLTPRGRRLGSFRFLESLGVGCIPVILSDNWVLPFTEIIDWNSAAIRIAEENVLLTTDAIFSLPKRKIDRMREISKKLYDRYFSSVEKITLASLEIVFSRVKKMQRSLAKATPQVEFKFEGSFTAIIFTAPKVSSKLQKIITEMMRIKGMRKIFILWHKERGTAPIGADFGTNVDKEFIVYNTTNWCLSCIPMQKLANIPSSVLFFDERLGEMLINETQAMLGQHKKFPEKLFTLHTFEYIQKPSFTTGIPRVFKIAFPSMAIAHSSYLTTFPLRGSNPECDWVRLSVAASYLSYSPPIRIGSTTLQSWMKLQSLNRCSQQLSPHFSTDLQLPPADQSYIL
ncbi:unnamed protein product, partial [Mesorhabditis belari]|uniref:Exostosin GT47 domain-containing protein n=1 Tax=Mesorhabditis belari TaxID=2138241 RepID=A0AAF3J6G2_9BILA